MRHAPLFLSLLFLAGCPSPPTDPDLAKPCGSRRTATFAVGTGADHFETLDAQPLQIQTAGQGGHHLWFAVSARGLGPDLALSYGIKLTADGTDIAGPSDQVIPLAFDPASNTDLAVGIFGFLAGGVDATLTGKEVLFWGDATDSCHTTPLHSEAKATVAGYAP